MHRRVDKLIAVMFVISIILDDYNIFGIQDI